MQARIVLDANVFVAAFSTRRGASFRVLARLGTGAFELVISVPLVFAYDDALTRELMEPRLTRAEIGGVVDYVCSVGKRQEIFLLWRPILRDPGDDLVLETAVAGHCNVIVTHNVRDFDRAKGFGIRALSPGVFLNELDGVQ